MKSMTTVLTLIGLLAAPTVAEATFTQSKAESSVEAKVRSVYRSKVGKRTVIAFCHKVTSRFYDCEYGVQNDGPDGFQCGPWGEGCYVYKYIGTGTVRYNAKMVTTVSEPS